VFLIALAAFGFSAWILLGHFSPIYAIVNGLWCIVFTEWWRHQETDLVIRWGVRGVSKMERKRREFRAAKVITDPITGENVGFFPNTKRLQRQLWQIPFALIAASLLGLLIATCFGIEVFISEVYDGPLKTVLVCFISSYSQPLLIDLGLSSNGYCNNCHANPQWYVARRSKKANRLREL
jgi:anoctamin-10